MPRSQSPFTTRVHHYRSPHTPYATAYEIGLPDAQNAYVFIGGLGDGPHTVPYPRAVAKHLESLPDLSYSVFEIRMKSSFDGWGCSSLVHDVEEISALVKYIRGLGRQKIVLNGHSTGCQDIMEYNSPVHKGKLTPVDGYILQGPVCDRAALALEIGIGKLDESVAAAKSLIENGRGLECVPRDHVPVFMRNTPISADRWHALAAVDGADNYFDPDLPQDVEQKYWESVEKPVLILHSAEDEFVPTSLDKEALVKRWMAYCSPGIASGLSGTIPGASHRVGAPEAEEWFVKTVAAFLGSLEVRDSKM
ncbi:duf1749 domain-containing protein [Microdochium trichocladiopsis]|uniref:Duf1749 domain-containing protein n=1 Tax=Microdochium trichocladiopsis TaxID=1682393 RepID=A0A9P8YJG7_9PEZI|nr:duf1749 domain-containing protein [Microdochium trichocladiopsis]KAH7041028.1 duf1749 domain-containing protein [Microdochium trichocladiopsis]